MIVRVSSQGLHHQRRLLMAGWRRPLDDRPRPRRRGDRLNESRAPRRPGWSRLDRRLVAGITPMHYTALPVGTYELRIQYGPEFANFDSEGELFDVTVAKADTTLTLTDSNPTTAYGGQTDRPRAPHACLQRRSGSSPPLRTAAERSGQLLPRRESPGERYARQQRRERVSDNHARGHRRVAVERPVSRRQQLQLRRPHDGHPHRHEEDVGDRAVAIDVVHGDRTGLHPRRQRCPIRCSPTFRPAP